jgi:hypothetical protein
MAISPYLKPGFYDDALAKGRHRDIVGGRWDETGRIQMRMLADVGVTSADRFLDIGAGSLRLGCKLIPWLDAGNYWATDASRALMLRGYDRELEDKSRLDPARLVEDADFAFSGIPGDIDVALAFGVFTHLPLSCLDRALASVRRKFPGLRMFLFTTFLAPEATAGQSYRQKDGVVTHPDRTPYHFRATTVVTLAEAAGFELEIRADRLPRGQVLCIARPDV